MIDKEEKQNNMVNIYATFHDIKEVETMITIVIKHKLAMSADYWLVNSFYPWNGIIKKLNQYMVMFTTCNDLAEKLVKYIESKHSYQIPFITGYESNFSNGKYMSWSDESLNCKTTYLTQEEFNEFKKNKESKVYEKLK